MNVKRAIQEGSKILKENNIEEPNIKIKLLMQNILKKTRQYIIANDTQELSKEQEIKYLEGIQKLKNNMPIEYITNQKEFMKKLFYVDENVLIPRQDTEILVEEVIKIAETKTTSNQTIINNNLQILDMCTGSGAIAVSLASYIDKSEIDAVDISQKALEITEKNAKENKVEKKIKEIESNLYKNIGEKKYDIIVSNPPYIKHEVIKKLDKQVQKEPLIALDGGDDGLEFYRKIIKQSTKYLKKDGYLCLEIGYDQKDEVINLLNTENKYKNIYSKKDLCGNDRIVIAQLG